VSPPRGVANRLPQPRPFDPRRPVVLITGATQGIGRATAELYAARGAQLVLCARSADTLAEVRVVCEDLGADVEVVVTDVVEDTQVERAVAVALARFGRLAYGHHTDTTADVFAHVVNTNLVGAANVARASLAVFRAQGAGTLVVVGSVLGRVAVPGMGATWPPSGGCGVWCGCCSRRNRDLPGVRVTSVAPGSVRTSIYSSAVGGADHSATPPPPSTSPRTVARQIRAAAERGAREHGVDDRTTNPLATTALVRRAQGLASTATVVRFAGQGHTLLGHGDAAGRLAAQVAVTVLTRAGEPPRRATPLLRSILTGTDTVLDT